MKILISFFLVFNICQASIVSDTYKVCNYNKLGKSEKDQLIAHAFENYLPEAYKNRFKRGLNNYISTTKEHIKQEATFCQSPNKSMYNIRKCRGVPRKNKTFYIYDVESAYNAIMVYIQSNPEVLENIKAICSNAEKNIEQILADYNPNLRFTGKSLSAKLKRAKEMASILSIELEDKRKHNPIYKDAIPKKGDFIVSQSDCLQKTNKKLTIIEDVQLTAIKMAKELLHTFSPKPPLSISISKSRK